MSKNIRAEEAEHAVWSFVTGLLLNPEALREGLNEMMQRERAGNHGNPEEKAAVWLDRLAAAERKRTNFQDMAAEGLITFDELGAKLAAVEETRQTARRELAALDDRTERLQALERDRDALLKNYAEMMPEALDVLQPEERHRIYKMLRLKTVAFPDGALQVSGALGEELLVCKKQREGDVLAAHREQGRGGRAGQGRLPHRRGRPPPQR